MGRNSNSPLVAVIAPHKQNLNAANKFLEEKVCDIPLTNTKKRLDAYKSMIPLPKTVLKYDICQTDTKLKKAVETGIAQVHVTQTDALYKYPPSNYVFPEDATEITKKIQYCSRGPPVWKFEQEKWWSKVQRQQKKSKHNFIALTAENKKYDKMKFTEAHQKLSSMVGPDWFQELSPQQLSTVDSLKTCIVKDKKYNTINHTQENINSLGLMTHPKPKHIKTALDHCCECPVEFLLILYQLLNGKRTEYSINDRLLLSGVAHLTIKETLKELHIRIPSPPPPLKPKKVQKPFPKRTQYKSPYLQPFDFVPCPPKHTGIYKNNHVQYPESPYFSYLTELKEENTFKSSTAKELYIQKKQSGITLKQYNDILQEFKTAEKRYEELSENALPSLLKPSIYIPCDHGLIGTTPIDDAEESTSTKDLKVSLKITSNYNSAEDAYKKTCECNAEEEPIIYPPTSSSQESENIIKSRSSLSTVMEQDSKPESPKKEKTPTTPQKISRECTCKEEAEKMIAKNMCQCKTCKQSQNAKEKNTQSIKTEKESLDKDITQCDCLEKYRNRIKLYEEIKQRFTVQHNLMSLPEKFVVGGVTQGPDGQPVYMLSGVMPNHECSCAKIYQEYLKEQERLANMPHLPLGKQKYIVSGVHPTDEGNVFVLAGAVDTEECFCQKLYKSYEERHTTCLDAYDKYVKKVEVDVVEYTQDIENDTRFDPASLRSLKGSNASNPSRNPSIPKEYENKLTPILESCEENKHKENESKPNTEETVCECGQRNKSKRSSDSLDVCMCISPLCVYKETEVCECAGKPNVCTCKTEPVCTCNDKESVKQEEDPEMPLRRYTILDKIPCKYSQQIEILQKALVVMGEDGFPLAKLPDSWKLPIFKLWMQMRCGKNWNQDNRVKLYNMSMAHWHHTNHCKGKVKQSAKLGMPPEEADKYTWSHAQSVRRIALIKETSYYREIKQIAINEAREFFPTIFSYELPTSAFRDCYFSYLPPKEDACTCWRPWYIHEYKK